MKMKNETYDKLNWLSNFVPLLVTFLGVVLPALNIGDATCNAVLTIVGALGAFLNGTLKISSIKYLKDLESEK